MDIEKREKIIDKISYAPFEEFSNDALSEINMIMLMEYVRIKTLEQQVNNEALVEELNDT